jgi:excisionase family DNA binding protein
METVDFLVYQKQQHEQLNRIEAAALSQKSVLTFEEACRFTGLSRSKMYKHTSANTVPFSKPFGKLVYFERELLERWMLQNPISTTDEIENQVQRYCMNNRKGG